MRHLGTSRSPVKIPSPDDNVRVGELYQKTAITEWEDVPNIIYVSSTHLLHQHVEDDEEDELDEEDGHDGPVWNAVKTMSEFRHQCI